MEAWDLVEEDHAAVAQDGEVGCFSGVAGDVVEDGAAAFDDVEVRGLCEGAEFGAEANAAASGVLDDEAFCGEGAGDSLYRGAGQVGAGCDLSEAEAAAFVFQDAQDRGGAGDHLDAGAFLFVIFYRHLRWVSPRGRMGAGQGGLWHVSRCDATLALVV
ncbi:hypothetical protein ATO2_18665 [Roseovarius sp. 22II1-1F6A]|nr:hypothetical protein ATO2_18665 [Roseovarius sp. 22II1-1F6A]